MPGQGEGQESVGQRGWSSELETESGEGSAHSFWEFWLTLSPCSYSCLFKTVPAQDQNRISQAPLLSRRRYGNHGKAADYSFLGAPSLLAHSVLFWQGSTEFTRVLKAPTHCQAALLLWNGKGTVLHSTHPVCPNWPILTSHLNLDWEMPCAIHFCPGARSWWTVLLKIGGGVAGNI